MNDFSAYDVDDSRSGDAITNGFVIFFILVNVKHV